MSEFGRGYAVCLRQFLWHEPKLGSDIERYRDLSKVNPELFDVQHGIEMWANGAADHLIDIKRPRRFVTNAEWQLAKSVSDTAWAAGRMWVGSSHVVDESEIRATVANARTLLENFARRAGVPFPDTFEAAWELDEAAGLKPQRGDSATCVKPLEPR